MLSRLVFLACLIVGGCSLVVVCHADEPKDDATTPEATADDQSTALFDGESLKNWKITDFGRQGEVAVKEGQLIIHKGKPLSGVTWDGEDLPRVNYEITLECQRVEGSDFFCGLTFPVQESPCTLIVGGWGGSLTGLSSINYQDASENETTNFFDIESGKWYKVRLRVTKTRIQAWLDDAELADVDYSDKKIGIRFEMELCKPLGLATYNTTSAVRKFTLRELTAEDLAEAQPEAE
jgi:hypothetical protein